MAAVFALLLIISGETVVLIPQIPADLPPRSLPARQTSPRPVSAGQEDMRGIRKMADGRIAISKVAVEACRRVELGEKAPDGIDCVQVMQIVHADARRSAEGALLGLLGEKSDVTRGMSTRATVSSDADAVARDISNGVANGDAAAVAARQRGAPPASSPR